MLSHFSHVRLFATLWTVQPSRFLCPWNSAGKNTGVSCHFLLQGIFPNQGSNPSLLASCTGRWVLYHQHHLGTLLNFFCMTCEAFMIRAPWILSPSTLVTLIMAHTSLSHFLCGSDSQALLWAFFRSSSSVWNAHPSLSGLSFTNSPGYIQSSSGQFSQSILFGGRYSIHHLMTHMSCLILLPNGNSFSTRNISCSTSQRMIYISTVINSLAFA